MQLRKQGLKGVVFVRQPHQASDWWKATDYVTNMTKTNKYLPNTHLHIAFCLGNDINVHPVLYIQCRLQ